VARARQTIPLLKTGNIVKFGQLMNACHVSLRDLYEVSCPELDIIVNIAQSLPGCFGARLTGAGFGGCAVALVEAGAVSGFEKEIQETYSAQTHLSPEIYITKAARGAEVKSLNG
jgi:galactokinase